MTAWVSRFGVPLHVITDRGEHFEAELFSELSSIVGFHRIRTTAIMARKQSWLLALPVVLLGIRAAPNDSGYSPFTAVTGSSILVPSLLIDNILENGTSQNSDLTKQLSSEILKLDIAELSQGKIHSKPREYIPKDLFKCGKVWMRIDRVRRPLEAPYAGPYKVLQRASKYFLLEISCSYKCIHRSVKTLYRKLYTDDNRETC